ncbi:alpha/beta hydrolase [Rhodoferax sp.]|uniref:dienelactone hydrolase family protein n=1 Tax=Rhodoferax sp. TaxID=50421 RepID=UPI001ECEA0FE|nr:alpha/beta hydrolase [Rhodoferax sp.]MBT9505071.1 alpha/beta hydrolase [Rhodoferax sp.]
MGTHCESVLIGSQGLPGDLEIPANPIGIVVIVPASEGDRHSPRHQFVAHALQSYGLATLMFDLLAGPPDHDRHPVLDIAILRSRVTEALHWIDSRTDLAQIPVGLFGASTGATAALLAAAREPSRIAALVSRGGRPDLAGSQLGRVRAPTLLIVGSENFGVLELNRYAMRSLPGTKTLTVVPGANNSFEESGALDAATSLAGNWFLQHLQHPALH